MIRNIVNKNYMGLILATEEVSSLLVLWATRDWRTWIPEQNQGYMRKKTKIDSVQSSQKNY